jgi:hypothetical protein
MPPRLSEFLNWARVCAGEQSDIFEVHLFLNSRCYPFYFSTSISVSIRHSVRLSRIVHRIFFPRLFPICLRLLDHCSPDLSFAPTPQFASYGSSFCPAPLFACCPSNHVCPCRRVSLHGFERCSNYVLIFWEGRVLSAPNEPEHSTGDDVDGTDVPEEIEAALEELFQALQDRVRF